jgi:hypothetical protein
LLSPSQINQKEKRVNPPSSFLVIFHFWANSSHTHASCRTSSCISAV